MTGDFWDEAAEKPIPQDDDLFTRKGDPHEFDEELTGKVVEPNQVGSLEVPHGLVRQLLANPPHAPELLASRAVEQFAERAARDVRLLRERNPAATDRQLAVYFKQTPSRPRAHRNSASNPRAPT